MMLGFIFGAAIACLLIPQTSLIFSWLTTDPSVAEAGAPYLVARLAAQPVTGINFALYGFWHGVTRPLVYLPSLLVMQVANVFFNYVLIFGRRSGETRNRGGEILGCVGNGGVRREGVEVCAAVRD
jgi:Na+-driven multidrug efflux pump